MVSLQRRLVFTLEGAREERGEQPELTRDPEETRDEAFLTHSGDASLVLPQSEDVRGAGHLTASLGVVVLRDHARDAVALPKQSVYPGETH